MFTLASNDPFLFRILLALPLPVRYRVGDSLSRTRIVFIEELMAKKTPKLPKATKTPTKVKTSPATEIYEHKDATVALRPDVGTQAQFKKQKPAQRYRYDSSLSPALEWDGQNSAREQGEALIAEILALADKLKAANSDGERDVATSALQEAARKLKALGKPFLDWAGKAERLSFDVPTLGTATP